MEFPRIAFRLAYSKDKCEYTITPKEVIGDSSFLFHELCLLTLR